MLPASIAPRATGHVTQMIDMMARLIERGHAYAAAGDVYFAVRSYPEYGTLSGQRLDDVAAGRDRRRGQARPTRLHDVEGRAAG